MLFRRMKSIRTRQSGQVMWTSCKWRHRLKGRAGKQFVKGNLRLTWTLVCMRRQCPNTSLCSLNYCGCFNTHEARVIHTHQPDIFLCFNFYLNLSEGRNVGFTVDWLKTWYALLPHLTCSFVTNADCSTHKCSSHAHVLVTIRNRFLPKHNTLA